MRALSIRPDKRRVETNCEASKRRAQRNPTFAVPSATRTDKMIRQLTNVGKQILCDIAEMALLRHFSALPVSSEKLQQSDGQCGSAEAVRNENARDPLDEGDRLLL